jgi:hypothetical protein
MRWTLLGVEESRCLGIWVSARRHLSAVTSLRHVDTKTARHLRPASFFRLHNRPAHVVPALGTDGVSRHGGTALRAVGQLPGRFVIVRPAAAGFLVRLSPFGDGHARFLSNAAAILTATGGFKMKPHTLRRPGAKCQGVSPFAEWDGTPLAVSPYPSWCRPASGTCCVTDFIRPKLARQRSRIRLITDLTCRAVGFPLMAYQLLIWRRHSAEAS